MYVNKNKVQLLKNLKLKPDVVEKTAKILSDPTDIIWATKGKRENHFRLKGGIDPLLIWEDVFGNNGYISGSKDFIVKNAGPNKNLLVLKF